MDCTEVVVAVPRGLCSQAETAVEPLPDVGGIVTAYQKAAPVKNDRCRINKGTVVIVAPTTNGSGRAPCPRGVELGISAASIGPGVHNQLFAELQTP